MRAEITAGMEAIALHTYRAATTLGGFESAGMPPVRT
jgi:hypothetical protein